MDKLKELKKFIERQVKADEFSGAVLVVEKETSILEYTAGFANKEKQIPNEIETKFNIGSMDKMFSAVAIAQLVERNKISFQDKIEKYFPNYPKKIAEEITIHHILTHTEGFSSYFNKKYIASRLKLRTVNDYIALFINEPLLFKPGSKYQYSNSGYVVLGAIIEAVSGQSYYDYVAENIFKSARMFNTGSYKLVQDIPNLAHGYTYRLPLSKDIVDGPRRDNITELPQKGSPAGGGYSTCYDLFNFSQALLQNKLLSPEMTKRILTPKIEIGAKNNQTLYYGYGFQILKTGNHQRFGHAGSFAGVNARLDIYPDLGYVVVVLSNYDEPSAFRIANEAGKLILSE